MDRAGRGPSSAGRVAALFAVAGVVAFFWAWNADAFKNFDSCASLKLFCVRDVTCEVRDDDERRVSPEDVERAKASLIGKGVFSTDLLPRAQAAFESLAWVKKAELAKEQSFTGVNSVRVTLYAHKPRFKWGDGFLLDADGEAYPQPAPAGALAHLMGPEGDRQELMGVHAQLREVAQTRDLAVTALLKTYADDWELTLRPLRGGDGVPGAVARGREDGAILVRFGRSDPVASLALLMRVWDSDIRPIAESVDYIDMRYRNGFALKTLSPEDLQRRAAGLLEPNESKLLNFYRRQRDWNQRLTRPLARAEAEEAQGAAPLAAPQDR